MNLSMSALTLPVFKKAVSNLSTILNKAKEYCAEHQVEESVLLNARLYPDMFPLIRQVQVSCDQAKNAAAYLAGQAPVPFEDNETTIDQLLTRIERTLEVLGQLRDEQIDGSENRPVSFEIGPYKMSFPSGHVYLQSFVLPNFYFHVSTAYAILRHNGVALGKGDYLGDMGAEVGPAG